MKQPGITSRTGLLGVIGDPIGHSLSPVLHNHVLERLGLDYRYLAFHVTPERVERVGEAMRTLGLKGLNVTLPHKQAVLLQMDHLSPEARAVGAVNTVGLDPDGRLAGHNTDVAGFLGALDLRGLLERLNGGRALVLGAGARRGRCCSPWARPELKESQSLTGPPKKPWPWPSGCARSIPG